MFDSRPALIKNFSIADSRGGGGGINSPFKIDKRRRSDLDENNISMYSLYLGVRFGKDGGEAGVGPFLSLF